MISVTLEELRYAVLHDDRFNGDMFASDIDHVLEIAMMKIGFTALQSPVRIDIGNGEFIVCMNETCLLEAGAVDNGGSGWAGLDRVQMP